MHLLHLLHLLWGIFGYIFTAALDRVWRNLGTAWVGYWLPPIIGACVGWMGNKKYPTLRRIWIASRDAILAPCITFALVLAVECAIVLFHFCNPKMMIQAPGAPPLPMSRSVTKVHPPEQAATLKQRTLDFANDLFDWSVQQQGTLGSLKQQAIAQAFIDAIRPNKGNESAFQERVAAFKENTAERFRSYYWPKVNSLQDELRNAGVDTNPLSRAEASNDPPRAIAIALSLLADRIGKRGPFPRQITPLEMKFLAQQVEIANIRIYAYMPDANSRRVGEALRLGFSRQKGVTVNKKLYPLAATKPLRRGIWVIYPSADWTTSRNGFIPALNQCQLESRWEVQQMKHPPQIMKIQVWPESPNWKPASGPNLIR